jgi:hypothetical protein
MFCESQGQGNRRRFSLVLNSAAYISLATLSLAAIGCGKSQPEGLLTVFPATGTVSFKGAVPQGAYVALHSQGNVKAPNGQEVVPNAQVQPDGTFSLSSYSAADGAPEGNYVLTVEWHKTVKGRDGDPVLGPNLLPPQYSKPTTSPVKVTIVAGRNDITPIVLK